MLRYPCLVLDHDDTVVRSEATVNYPSFCLALDYFRPGETMSPEDFTRWCFSPGFTALLREKYHFSPEELEAEFQMWLRYAMSHIPPAFPGIHSILKLQRQAGGLICVVSQSSRDNILRDYRTHFDMEPDAVYGWELPEGRRKPSSWPLEDIRRRFGFSPEQMLVVDDLKPGWDMAKGAGVPFAFAGWGRKNVPEIGAMMEKCCDFSFDSPEELENFLFGGLDKCGIIGLS